MACIFCNQDVQATRKEEKKMYVWICTREPNCNLTCYNVQYFCIVFDLWTFMPIEIFDLVDLVCYPRCRALPFTTHPGLSSLWPPSCCFRWNTGQMCAFILLRDSSLWRRKCGASTELMYQGVIKTLGPVSVWSGVPCKVTEAPLFLFCIKSNFSPIYMIFGWDGTTTRPERNLWKCLICFWLPVGHI